MRPSDAAAPLRPERGGAAMSRIAAVAALCALACGGPWHIPPAMLDEGIVAWSYVEPRLAEREGGALPPVTVADFESAPPQESYHPNLGLPSLILPLVGWVMPPTLRSRNVVVLPVPSLRLAGDYELAPLRRYEVERILARELLRSGAFERVVADPRQAQLALEGRIDFSRTLHVHGLGLGLLYWPLWYWIPGGTLADRCNVELELVRLRDRRVLAADAFSVESRVWMIDRQGNELLLAHFGRGVLPQAVTRVVTALAAAESDASPP